MIAIIDPKNNNSTSISSHLLLQNESPNPTKKADPSSPIQFPHEISKIRPNSKHDRFSILKFQPAQV